MDSRGATFFPGMAKRCHCSSERPYWLWGPHGLLFNGHQRALPLGVKRPGREADYSLSSRSEGVRMDLQAIFIYSVHLNNVAFLPLLSQLLRVT